MYKITLYIVCTALINTATSETMVGKTVENIDVLRILLCTFLNKYNYSRDFN